MDGTSKVHGIGKDMALLGMKRMSTVLSIHADTALLLGMGQIGVQYSVLVQILPH